jgi:hypothetical protein
MEMKVIKQEKKKTENGFMTDVWLLLSLIIIREYVFLKNF